MRVVDLAPCGNHALFNEYSSVLVRPDGYLGHIHPAIDKLSERSPF